MSDYLLSPAAQDDVEDIWDYTVERWNEDQAVRYVHSIRVACEELTTGARISREVEFRDGYRKTSVGSHVIFFKRDENGSLIVMRILHQRMDIDRHL